MKSRGLKIGTAVLIAALCLLLAGIRTYVLAVELDPLTGFAAPGQGRWQNVFLAVLLAGTAVTAALCFFGRRAVGKDGVSGLPVGVRWVGATAAVAMAADAAVGSVRAVQALGLPLGVLLTLAKLAVAYSVFAQGLFFTGGRPLALHPASAAVETVPVLYCIAILLDAFLNYVAYNSTSQHLIEQMSVIAVMLFFLSTLSFCVKVNRTGDAVLAVASGLLGLLYLSVTALPPLAVFLITGNLPAFLTKAVGFSPVMGLCLAAYLGAFSLSALLQRTPKKAQELDKTDA